MKITELDATQTARALQDVDASVINSGMAVDAGYTPDKDAIFLRTCKRKSETLCEHCRGPRRRSRE